MEWRPEENIYIEVCEIVTDKLLEPGKSAPDIHS